MPKCYSEREREYIQQCLKKEAKECMIQYGIRKTTVDEIVKRVNIPKGTFYLFYKSKELLLFDVIVEQQELVQQEFQKVMLKINPDTITADELADIIFSLHKKAEENDLLRVLKSSEIELLARKLPPESLKTHFKQDDTDLENIISVLPNISVENKQIFSASFRALYMITTHKTEIGEQQYDDVLRVLIKGLVLQMMND